MSVLDVINPYDNALVAQVPVTTQVGIETIIERAYQLRASFAQMPAYERGDILNQTAELISQSRDELAQLMVQESGKPLRYARGEVGRAIETFTFAADEARRLHGETIPMDAARNGVGKIGFYVREPIGVIGAITPFNFPLNLVAHKVAPAIACGCPIVLKPSPFTPLSSLRLAKLLVEAGLPEGIFQVVVGDADVGRWLTTDPRIAMLTFTGSLGVASAISQVAGIRRTTFELGGNAATIITETTPITDTLINRLLVGSFAYSGQVCISVQRLYIHESIYQDVRDKLVDHCRQMTLGDPLNETTDIGPLINDQATKRIQIWLKEAIAAGARVVCGGHNHGRMFEPTILENVTNTMKVMCAEVFGPVVNLVPYTDFETVLAEVNDTTFGLQAGVYTNDMGQMMRAIRTLETGGIMINDVPTFRVDHMPYGGNKDSGTGREGPRFAIEEMTTLKMIVMNQPIEEGD